MPEKAEGALRKIKEIIAKQLEIPKEEVDKRIVLDADIINDLGADSMDFVEIVMQIEETFEISMPDATLEKIRTVRDLLTFVMETSR
jgi:acyl carrier protein